MKNVKERFRTGERYLLMVMLFSIAACTTFLDDEKYTGLPHSLRYMPIDTYRIGDDYVSIAPTVMGGENARFTISSIAGPSSEEVLNASFSIDAQNGNINIKEFCNLLPGNYSLDVEVKNASGNKVFNNAFSFTAEQVPPTKLNYVPSLYSFYASELGDKTSVASVNGGGPYLFTMDDPLNYFSIDELTGSIAKEAVVEIEEDDKLIQTLDVTVANELGKHTQSKAVTIEIIGSNVGKVAFNAEYKIANAVSLGLVNAYASTLTGVYSDVIMEQEYSTELNENGPVYKGNRHTNTWHAYGAPIKKDVSANGNIENELFLSFKTASSTTECVSMVVSEAINLKAAKSAYAEIVAYKRYIDNDFNQRFELLICDDEAYDANNVFDNSWELISENIAPGMLPYSNPILESKLLDEGSQSFDIPNELLGKKIRLALKAVHLNPDLGKIGREAFVYKWQVRAMY